MINFRFHLVSLVAVFLALTIGIVVGASVVNQQVVDGLNRRINTVENNADKQRSENQLLRGKVKELQSYLETAAPYMVEGRLTAVPVAVIAEQGIDRDPVHALVTLLHDAGAQTPAIVWLQPKWALEKPDDRTELAAIVDGDAASSGLRVQALNVLADRLGTAVSVASGGGSGGAASSTTTTVKSAPPTDVLTALTSAGFVSIEAMGASGTTDLSTFPQAGARVVLVSGQASDVPPQVFLSLAKELSALAVPTVAAEVYQPTNGQPSRGTVVKPIRNDSALHDSVSTVDDLDIVPGQVAVVLALAELGEGKVGHYGYGSGADQALPAWSGP
jgi:Copper transport outer membrane protein, MctB